MQVQMAASMQQSFQTMNMGTVPARSSTSSSTLSSANTIQTVNQMEIEQRSQNVKYANCNAPSKIPNIEMPQPMFERKKSQIQHMNGNSIMSGENNGINKDETNVAIGNLDQHRNLNVMSQTQNECSATQNG